MRRKLLLVVLILCFSLLGQSAGIAGNKGFILPLKGQVCTGLNYMVRWGCHGHIHYRLTGPRNPADAKNKCYWACDKVKSRVSNSNWLTECKKGCDKAYQIDISQ